MTQTIVKYSKTISWGVIKDEIFVFKEDTRNIYLLKNLDKHIWMAVGSASKMPEIIKQIQRSDPCSDDEIHRRIEKLVNKDLLRWSNL